MSSHNYDQTCPICSVQMEVQSDTYLFDHAEGTCLNCGLTFYAIVKQLKLEEVNEARINYNDDAELKGKNRLKPLTQKYLDKFKDQFEEIQNYF